MPLLLIVAYVLAEMLVFSAISSWIGFGWAFLAMVGLMIVGTLLSLAQLRGNAVRSPEAMGATSLLMIALLCSSVPGYLTSVVAFLLIIPPTRQLILNAVTQRVQKYVEDLGTRLYASSPMAQQQNFYGTFTDADSAGHRPYSGPSPASDPNVIDAEEIKSWAENVDPEDFKGNK